MSSSTGSYPHDTYASSDDHEYIEEEIIEEEEGDEDDENDIGGDDGSIMNDILQEKLERIAVLELKTQQQEQKIQNLTSKANETKVHHEKEVHLLRLELDGSKRDCTAAEERMAELFDDLKHVAAMQERKLHQTDGAGSVVTNGNNGGGGQDNDDDNYNYAAEVLENQISMVQTTSGEVIKTLKDEISDLMEDRCRMELDLLNQLATLDREKRSMESDFTQRLHYKDETIERLRQHHSTSKNGSNKNRDGGNNNNNNSNSNNGDIDMEMEEELLKLTHEKKYAEDMLVREREESDELIQRLEDQNTKLQNKINNLTDDLTLLREGPDTDTPQDHITALDRIAKERSEITSMLEKVASIWEKADMSLLGLEESMDKLRPVENVAIKGDRERLLSTLETASLIHGQVKVALLLVEVRLRNQLQSLKNDRSSMTWAAPSDDEIVESMREILEEGLAAVSHVEATITAQVRTLEERALEETKLMKDMISDRSKTLECMQEDHKTLEKDIHEFKSNSTGNHDSNGNITAASTTTTTTAEEIIQSPTSPSTQPQQQQPPPQPRISEEIVEQLHVEVHRILERIREKNELITAMKQKLDGQKVTEENLRKELKRAAAASNRRTTTGSLTSPTTRVKKNTSTTRSLNSTTIRSSTKGEVGGSSSSVVSNNKQKRHISLQQPTSPTTSLQPEAFTTATGNKSAIMTPPLKSPKRLNSNNATGVVPVGLPLSPTNTTTTTSTNNSSTNKPTGASAAAATTPINGPKRTTSKVKSPIKSPRKNSHPSATAATSPVRTSTTTPTIQGQTNNNNNESGEFASPVKNASTGKKFIQLLPSPREISKPRFTNPL